MKSFDCKACAVGARQSQTLGAFFQKLLRGGKYVFQIHNGHMMRFLSVEAKSLFF